MNLMNAIYRNLTIGLVAAALLGGGLYMFVLPHLAAPSANAAQPSLDKPYVITITMPDDAKSILVADVTRLKQTLQTDPQDFDSWLDLALHYKIAGDYKDAEEVWKYIVQTGPQNTHYIALGNLGNLYEFFLKDYPKAEEFLLQAIALKPDQISFYRDLYTLYHYGYKVGTGADSSILEQGLKANPGDKDLLNLQQQLKAGK